MILFSCWIFFGKKLGTQHYPTVVGVGYTTPTYEIMDVGCWVHNNQLYKSWLLGTQQPTNFSRCVVLCWFLLVQPMSGCKQTKTLIKVKVTAGLTLIM